MLSASFDDEELVHAEPAAEVADNARPPKLRKTETLLIEENAAIDLLNRAARLRRKYQEPVLASASILDALSQAHTIGYRFDSSGILELTASDRQQNRVVASCDIDVGTFSADYADLIKIVTNGTARTFCHQRLMMLQQRFDLHETEQGDVELREMGRGQMAASTSSRWRTTTFTSRRLSTRQVLKYVKTKLTHEADTVVAVDGGTPKSLSQLFREAGLDETQLGLDAFHCSRTTHSTSALTASTTATTCGARVACARSS